MIWRRENFLLTDLHKNKKPLTMGNISAIGSAQNQQMSDITTNQKTKRRRRIPLTRTLHRNIINWNKHILTTQMEIFFTDSRWNREICKNARRYFLFWWCCRKTYDFQKNICFSGKHMIFWKSYDFQKIICFSQEILLEKDNHTLFRKTYDFLKNIWFSENHMFFKILSEKINHMFF